MKRSGNLPRYTTLKPGQGSLKRSGIKRGSKGLKRTGISRTNRQKRAMKEAIEKLLYCDSHNVPFCRHEECLPENVSDWLIVEDVTDDSVCKEMHRRFTLPVNDHRVGKCWLCGKTGQLECHHIVPRSDEPTNICMAGGRFSKCRCHERVQDNPAALQEVLRAKVTNDKANTNWVTLALLRHKKFDFNDLDP